MSVTVKPGEVYECNDMRFGESSKGDWAFFSVNAKKGYDKIKIFAKNPTAVRDAKAVKVMSIENVELKSRLDERSGKWFKDYTVTAVLEQAESSRQGSGSAWVESPAEVDAMFGLDKLNF